MTPYQVIEVEVHHHPRLYGRSQFFRVKSLLTTLGQLMRLYIRTVILAPFVKADPVRAMIWHDDSSTRTP